MDIFFQICLQFFEGLNDIFATIKRSFSITLLLLSSLYSFFRFSLDCFPLSFQTFFFIDLIPSNSTVFSMPPDLNDIHPVSPAHRSSFIRDLCLLFMVAVGTIELCQEFRARMSFLKVVQVLRCIMRSSVPPAVRIREFRASKYGKRKAGAALKSMFGRAESSISRWLWAGHVRGPLFQLVSYVTLAHVLQSFYVLFSSR